jgi:hypothetical protein
VLEFPSRAIRKEKEKEIKETQIGKEEVKLFLFVGNVILYLKDPKDSTKKLLDLINAFGNITVYKTQWLFLI